MKARKATTGRHYVLETNFRSTHAVVDAVNHWFDQADISRAEGAFMYRQGKVNPLPSSKCARTDAKKGSLHPPALCPP